jgi:hypothetical protein
MILCFKLILGGLDTAAMVALTVAVAFECSCLHAHGLPFQRKLHVAS